MKSSKIKFLLLLILFISITYLEALPKLVGYLPEIMPLNFILGLGSYFVGPIGIIVCLLSLFKKENKFSDLTTPTPKNIQSQNIPQISISPNNQSFKTRKIFITIPVIFFILIVVLPLIKDNIPISKEIISTIKSPGILLLVLPLFIFLGIGIAVAIGIVKLITNQIK